jgi:DNA-binding LacI/PurR family transcriptional regulator
MTAMITPPLTTVKQPLDAIGEKSAEKLIDKLENKEFVRESVINSNIIYRDSVKKIN